MPPASKETTPRENTRVPFQAQVNIEFEKFSGFITEFAANISPGGMFVKSKDPKPVGTVLSFEFKLADNYKLMQGLGEVVWVRTNEMGPDKPAGMGVRFHDLDPQSRELVTTMVEQFIRRGGKAFTLEEHAPAISATAREPEPVKGVTAIEEDFKALFQAADPFQKTAADGADSAAAPAPLLHEPTPASSEIPMIEDESVAETFPDSSRIRDVPPISEDLYEEKTSTHALRPRLLGLLAVIVAASGTGFFFRDSLLGLVRTKRAAEVVTRSTVIPTASTERPPTAVPEVKVTPVPTVTAKKEIPTFPAASTIENITWKRGGKETLVTIHGNGSFGKDVATLVHLEGGPPREVIKILGIQNPYPKTKLAVKSPELKQIRIGFHPGAAGGEIHIVLDLARRGVRVLGMETVNKTLVVRLSGS